MKPSLSLGVIILSSLILTSCWKSVNTTQTGSTESGGTFTTEVIDLKKDSLEALSSHIYSASGNANIGTYIQELTGSEPATKEKRAYLNSFV